LLAIDPKMVELSVYNGIPHLLSPVVTDVEQAAKVLFWAVKEMERRYQLCSKANARDLERYNTYLAKRNEKPLPYIVVIVDEMADLMMAAPEEVEKHICRLAQMARAVGIHLIVATQRPSTDVITGLIKANFPSRIAFAVSSQIDSRVILDMPGAERLLGKGDMLMMRSDASKVERLQGTFLDDEEINRVVRHWKGFRTLDGPSRTDAGQETAAATADGSEYIPGAEEGQALDDGTESAASSAIGGQEHKPAGEDTQAQDIEMGGMREPAPHQPDLFGVDLLAQVEEMQSRDQRDALFDEAVRLVEEAGRGSISLLQRKLRIGYSRSSRLVDQLEEAGILGPDLGGSQGRQVLTGRGQTQPTPEDTQANDTPRTERQPAQPTRHQNQTRTRHSDPEASPARPRIIGGSGNDEDEADARNNRRDGRNDNRDTPPRIWM
jgi:DNA segregation ATPase FtsK/SpoIIIE, S-DNA-T family